MLDAAHWTARLTELARRAGVPGAVLGRADGQEVLAACGVLSGATAVPVTFDSLFQVGSITKIWTATMIMQLVDEGRLSLDTTVSQVLPGARLGAADVGDQVTVQHLLTHTSGIDGDIFTDTGRGDDCVQRYVGQLDRATSAFPPGGAYSGPLAALVGAEPEEVTLHPVDASGTNFVCRSRQDEPWTPLSFGQLADHAPYVFLGGRVTPRVA